MASYAVRRIASRIAVRDSIGTVIGERRGLQLIAGTAITLTYGDDASDDDVNVEIAANLPATDLITDPIVTWTAGAAGRDQDIVSINAKLTTTTAVQATLATIAHDASTTVDYTVRVVGRRVSNGDSYQQSHQVMYTRDGSGAVTLVGALSSVTAVASAGAAAWASTVDFSGTDVRVRVTGGAYDVHWTAEIRAQEVK